MKKNIKKGIFRIYLVIWTFMILAGLSDLFYKGDFIGVDEDFIIDFLLIGVAIPIAILFVTKWIVKGFETSEK